MDYNSFKSKVEQFIENRNNIHDNDPALYQFWNRFADFLAQEEALTIQFLNDTNANNVDLISEIFEDISEKVKSKKFIECLEALEIKFPEKLLKHSINAAKSFI